MVDLEQPGHLSFCRLFHESPVGYLVLDNIGVIHASNETFRRMVDREEDQLLGQSLATCIPDVERGVFLARYRTLFKNPGGQSLESFIRCENGPVIYVHLRGARSGALPECCRVDGRPLLLLAVIDQTERKLAEENLLQK